LTVGRKVAYTPTESSPVQSDLESQGFTPTESSPIKSARVPVGF